MPPLRFFLLLFFFRVKRFLLCDWSLWLSSSYLGDPPTFPGSPPFFSFVLCFVLERKKRGNQIPNFFLLLISSNNKNGRSCANGRGAGWGMSANPPTWTHKHGSSRLHIISFFFYDIGGLTRTERDVVMVHDVVIQSIDAHKGDDPLLSPHLDERR